MVLVIQPETDDSVILVTVTILIVSEIFSCTSFCCSDQRVVVMTIVDTDT